MLHRFLPVLAFLFTLALGLFTASLVYRSEEIAQQARFEQFSDEVVDRIATRLNEYISMMVGVRGFLQTARPADRDSFSSYIYSFGLEESFGGIRAIGFAPVRKNDQSVSKGFGLPAYFSSNLAIHPKTDLAISAPIILLEPMIGKNRTIMGYDLYSNDGKRLAIEKAFEIGGIQATGPVSMDLDQTEGDTAEQGFFMFLPAREVDLGVERQPASLGNERLNRGLVYAMFEYDEFMKYAIGDGYDLPVVISVSDSGSDAMPVLYQSSDYETLAEQADYSSVRQFQFAGRSWAITVTDTEALRPDQRHLGSMVLAALALLLAVAFYIAARLQQSAVESAQRLALFSSEASAEKDLLLQEMKHRIKNHIARIQSIARQTVATSNDLAEFSGSFDSRMQAMAEAQDMLTRSVWQKAELRELALKELQQIFGENFDDSIISGPDIKLDEKQTQALGLIFHELATNAMKYGSASKDEKAVVVRWSHAEDGMIDLVWSEKGTDPIEKPSKTGFGTRLIQANVEYELKGKLDRQFHETGIDIHISFPMAKTPSPRKNRRRARKSG